MEQEHAYYNKPRTTEKIVVAATGIMLGLAVLVNGAYTVIRDLNKPIKKIENVTGGPIPEEFYEINGKRAYTSIDGQSLDEQLVTQRK